MQKIFGGGGRDEGQTKDIKPPTYIGRENVNGSFMSPFRVQQALFGEILSCVNEWSVHNMTQLDVTIG